MYSPVFVAKPFTMKGKIIFYLLIGVGLFSCSKDPVTIATKSWRLDTLEETVPEYLRPFLQKIRETMNALQ